MRLTLALGKGGSSPVSAAREKCYCRARRVRSGPYLMSRLVMKFGGTSVGDVDRIARVARIVASERKAGRGLAVGQLDEEAENGDDAQHPLNQH